MRTLYGAFNFYAISPWLMLLLLLRVGTSALVAEEPKPKARSSDSATSVAWLPEDTVGVIVVRPGEIAKQKGLAPLVELLSGKIASRVGVSLVEIDTLTLIVDPHAHAARGIGPFGCIITSEAKPLKIDPKRNEGAEKVTVADKSFLVNRATGVANFMPDERTLIVGGQPFVEALIRNGSQSNSSLVSSKTWNEIAESELAIAIDVPGVFKSVQLNNLRGAAADLLPAIAPLWQNTKQIYLGVKLGDKISLLAYAEPMDTAAASAVKDTLQATVTLGRNVAKFWSDKIPAAAGGGILEPVNELLKSAQVDAQERGRVRLRASAAFDGKLIAVVLGQVQAARNVAQRSVSANNLKQIALAMHLHHDVFKRFPASSNIKTKGGVQGQPCSWRVMILPYIEEGTLYQAYHFDEPWDSENNKKISAKMPAIFRNPLDAPESTNTSYFALVGPDTLFFNEKGANLREVIDGSSNTLMFVEAKRAVPWTKPEDIDYAADKPVPELGGWFDGGFNAAFSDGSVRFINKNVDEQLLRALITRGGREPIDRDKLQP